MTSFRRLCAVMQLFDFVVAELYLKHDPLLIIAYINDLLQALKCTKNKLLLLESKKFSLSSQLFTYMLLHHVAPLQREQLLN